MKMTFHPGDLKPRQEPDSIILVEPTFFQVVDRKNPYMKGSIDHARAVSQWNALKDIYHGLEERGLLQEVSIIPGAEGLEDMVFCANQSLPFLDENGPGVVLSNMRYPSRQPEVGYFADFYRRRGYRLAGIPEDLLLEGMGDCIFHPFTSLLWMGYGYRTSPEVAPILEDELGMPVVPLHLISEYFYHLDTCFLPVDGNKVLLCPEAFDEASLERINNVFDEVVEVSRRETVDTFCLNTHCIYSREQPVAVAPAGDHTVSRVLREEGYEVIEAHTSEFIKSGGSVFCMKMMYYG
jgi:N-dimethylarginine dimethylaminohydrolase